MDLIGPSANPQQTSVFHGGMRHDALRGANLHQGDYVPDPALRGPVPTPSQNAAAQEAAEELNHKGKLRLATILRNRADLGIG